MRFYLIRDCYFAQIEGSALIGLRLGYTTLGLAFWPPRRGRRPWWMPHLRLSLWAHTGQCDQRWVFLIAAGRHRFGFKTRGDATPDLMRYGEAGWCLR